MLICLFKQSISSAVEFGRGGGGGGVVVGFEEKFPYGATTFSFDLLI